MKKSSLHSRFVKPSGFTLVELLVVIGIIAILAAVILAAGGAALRAAQRAKAANLANQIQTACLNYYTEYSLYPVPTGTTTDYFIADSDATDWGVLIDALCGNLSPSTGTTVAATTITNTRSIAFLQLKSSDVNTQNAPLNPISFNSTADPYFNIGIDNDYSGIVGDSGIPPTSGSLTGIPNFSTSTQGNILPYTKPSGVTGGVIVWANCNTTTTAAKWNPGFFVHTY